MYCQDCLTVKTILEGYNTMYKFNLSKSLAIIPLVALQIDASSSMELTSSSLTLTQITSDKLNEVSTELDQYTELKIMIPEGEKANIRESDMYGLFCEMGKNHTLRSVSLTNLSLGDYVAAKISSVLTKRANITYLDLSSNDFYDRGVFMLAQAIERDDCSVETLILSNNKIGHKGATYIAAALRKNKSLKKLDLSHNQLNGSGACEISGSLFENKMLEELIVTGNNINKIGFCHLTIAIGENNCLKKIDLRNNPIQFITSEITDFDGFAEDLELLKKITKDREFSFEYTV